MSLKSFHRFFIAVCLGLMSFLAFWSSQHQGERAMLMVSLAGLVGGIGYIRWFLKEYRALR